MVVIAFIVPKNIKADNPGQACISDSRQVTVLGGNDLCVPLTSLDVTLTNGPGIDVCEACPTWYLSVWEWDGSTGYRQLGSSQPFSAGPVYTWTGLSWDSGSYPYIFLKWTFVSGPNGCPGFSTSPKFSGPYTPSGGQVSDSDFYPC